MQLLTCLLQRQRKLGGYINPPLVACILLIKLTVTYIKTSAYIKSYNGQTNFLIEDDDFLV